MDILPDEIILHIVGFCPRIIATLSCTCIRFYRLACVADDIWIRCVKYKDRFKAKRSAEFYRTLFAQIPTSHRFYHEIDVYLNGARRIVYKFHKFLDLKIDADKYSRLFESIFTSASDTQFNNYYYFIGKFNTITKYRSPFQKICMFLIALNMWYSIFLSVPLFTRIISEMENTDKYQNIPIEIVDPTDLFNTIEMKHSLIPYVYKYALWECVQAIERKKLR